MSRKREYLVARHQAERARRDRAVVRKQLTAVEGVVTSQRLTVIDPSPTDREFLAESNIDTSGVPMSEALEKVERGEALILSTTGAVEQASVKTCFKCGRTGKQGFEKVATEYVCKSRIACNRRQPVL